MLVCEVGKTKVTALCFIAGSDDLFAAAAEGTPPFADCKMYRILPFESPKQHLECRERIAPGLELKCGGVASSLERRCWIGHNVRPATHSGHDRRTLEQYCTGS